MQRLAFLSVALLSACALDKTEAPKGEVDESEPPSDPTEIQASGPKSDDPRNLVAYTLESAHPYSNNLNKTYTLDLSNVVPSCATAVKLHFSVLQTEAGYDFLRVKNGAGGVVQTFDGSRNNTWTSSWASLSASKTMSVQLVTDYSVVRDGFVIDQLEWQGAAACLPSPLLTCSADEIDLRKPAAACGCPEQSHCTPLGSVTIAHSVGGGFSGQVTGKKTVGTTMSTTMYLPSTGESSTVVATVDRAKLKAYLDHIAGSGVLYGAGRAESANWTECFSVTTDQESVSYCAEAGSHTPAVVDAITRFEALASCGDDGDATCNPGRTCNADGDCEEQGCICPAVYNPVCGTNGTTYSNGCAAACAQADVKHTGECGITGDVCGTIRGLPCLDSPDDQLPDYKCRFGVSQFTYPFPDAGGTCVPATYCDAPTDCAGLVHPAVLGQWTCPNNTCVYQPGPPPWNTLVGWKFESAHPYANNVAQWSQMIALPAGSTSMRLSTVGVFSLEANYDFLEVWTWTNGAWSRTKRYTGTVGPSANDQFTGQYFYLKFVTDSSVTREGFNVIAQYR
ncbi:MAG: Kazal-type serine protease inhibitor domain-containing protein [Kofleriaceae bacterium]